MEKKRIKRLNSLLQEVLSEVIRNDVKDPRIHELFTVTQVDISNDLHHAKVFISVIGTDKQKKDTIEALQIAAGFIAVTASKKVTMRYFPNLIFKIDTSVDEHMRIDSLLDKVKEEQQSRKPPRAVNDSED
jgi:ribosome-binding factor A